MMVILTPAPAKPCATANPPKPAPTMTTCPVIARSRRRHGIARGDPGIEPAMQGADLLEAVIHEDFGDLGRGSFTRTCAVQDDFPIARQILQMARHVLQGDVQRAGNPARLERSRGE